MLERRQIQRVVDLALDEDAPWGDVTCETLRAGRRRRAGRARGARAGRLRRRRGLRDRHDDARPVGQGHAGGRRRRPLRGRSRAGAGSRGRRAIVLQAERVALNLVQRMTGIATLTATYVAGRGRHRGPHRRHPQDHAGAARPGAARRALRRRPQPPLLALGRRDGQGQPPRGHPRRHRGAARRPPSELPHTTHIEVEVDRLDQIEPVLARAVDTIMLDNFTLDELRAGVAHDRRPGARRGQRRRDPRHDRRRSPRPASTSSRSAR